MIYRDPTKFGADSVDPLGFFGSIRCVSVNPGPQYEPNIL